MASLPVVIFQFALSPYADWRQLAWTGALLITLRGARAVDRRARPLRSKEPHHEHPTSALAQTSAAQTSRRASAEGRPADKIAVRDLRFYYGDTLALKSINLPLLRQSRHGVSSDRRAAASRRCCAC